MRDVATPRETSDDDLARAASDGDRDAFENLVNRHYALVFRVAWRMTGDRTEAEDLTQDICIALPAKLSGYRGQAKLTTWLYRVAVNASLDRLRRQASHARAADGWGEVELARRAEAANSREARDWLDQAMTALTPDLRATVALVLCEDLNQAEAAEALGVSPGTVAWRMSEVKKRLRELARQEGLA